VVVVDVEPGQHGDGDFDDDDGGSDDVARPGYRFQALMISFGVAQPGGLTIARMEELSGCSVSRETWRRVTTLADLPRPAILPAMAAALRAAGVDTTAEALTEVRQADWKARKAQLQSLRQSALKSGASAADLWLSVLRGLPNERERQTFMDQVTGSLTEEERVAWVTRMITQRQTPQEGTSGGGSTSGGPSTSE
jgi:hypothetical protein